MSMYRSPVEPAPVTTTPSRDEIVHKLREHLDEAEAQILARRYGNADRDGTRAVDWEAAKQRILKRKEKLQP